MEIAILVIAIIFGASIQGVAGMGFGMIVVPFLVWHFGAVDGITWSNLMGIFVSASLCLVQWRDIEWKKVGLFLLGSAPAVPLTIWALRAVPAAQMNLIVGILMLTMVTFAVFALKLPPLKGPTPAVITGTISGFLSVAVAQSGPIMAAYAQATRWEQRKFSATLQPYFVILALGVVSGKLALGMTEHPEQLLSWNLPLFIAAIAAGALIAKYLRRAMNPMTARYIAITIAIIGSIRVLLVGLGAL